MAYTFSAPVRTVRKEQYTSKAHLEIRALGTEEWYEPPAYERWKTQTSSNLERATFTPGVITVHQHAVNAIYNDDRRLGGALYMWQAKFNVADLYDIRVREYEFGRPKDGSPDDSGRIRVEVMAVCKVPPTGQGLFVREGTLREHVWNNAKETSEPTASSSGLAKISDRWASGEQEIKLTFTRTTQTERKSGKNKPGKKEAVSGQKVWVWHACLAFLRGLEWASDTYAQFLSAARMSLADVVDKDSRNPNAGFEKKEDGWVLLTKTDEAEQLRRAARAARFGPTDAAGPSAFDQAKPSTLPDRPSASALGKRKMTESVEEAGGGKRVEIETRESLEKELLKRRHRAEFLREEENNFRVRAEEEEECIRQLQLRLEELDR